MQPIEPFAPERSVLLGPAVDVVQGRSLETVDALETICTPPHQPGAVQNLEMLGHCRVRQSDFGHEIADWALAGSQHVN